MSNLIKAYLDIFIAVSLLIAFGQDFYKLVYVDGQKPAVTADGQPIQSATNTTETVDLGPQINGVVIKVTDGLRKPLQQVLTTEKYNVKVEPYKFEGPDWWFDTILSYGHIALVYMLMTKYKTETNEQTKKKIMYGGGLAVLAWFFLTPYLKHNKIMIEVNGVNSYTSNTIVANQIVSTISDQADFAELEQEVPPFEEF